MTIRFAVNWYTNRTNRVHFASKFQKEWTLQKSTLPLAWRRILIKILGFTQEVLKSRCKLWSRAVNCEFPIRLSNGNGIFSHSTGKELATCSFHMTYWANWHKMSAFLNGRMNTASKLYIILQIEVHRTRKHPQYSMISIFQTFWNKQT